MQKRNQRGYPTTIDFEIIYNLWLELGTIPKVQQEMFRRGMTGRNGRMYSKDAVSQNVRIWRAENEAIARERHDKVFASHYGKISDDEWYRMIYADAIRYLLRSSRGRWNRWRENNPHIVAYVEE